MSLLFNDISAASPIVLLIMTAMIVLLGDSCLAGWRQSKFASPGVSLIGIGVAFVLSLSALTSRNAPFHQSLMMDSFAESCNLILLIVAALAVFLAMTYLENRQLNIGEYYVLVLFSTAGGMLMVAANDLIVLFISIEILSVALYVLSGFARKEARSEEAALKYFLLGAFAAGFLLYGIALIYGGSAGAVGNGGTTNLTVLTAYLSNLPNHAPSAMFMSGVALVLVGLAFKAALVPFHMWTPDVYEGAPTSVTAYMACAAKIGAFGAIMRVFYALSPVSAYWLIAIQGLAILTMFGGNILALTQNNVKRMLAYSSVAHAGYLLVAVSAACAVMPNAPTPAQLAAQAAAQSAAFGALTFYLLAYSLMTMGSFGVLILLTKRGHDCQTMDDLKGLVRRDPQAAYIMLIFMLSLGGFPLTMGFVGKFYIFNAALLANQGWLAIALALASVISIYYYLRVVWTMCFQEPDKDASTGRAISPGPVMATVFVSLIFTVLLGVAPRIAQPLMDAATALIR